MWFDGCRRQNGEESDEEVIIIGDDGPEERVWPPASGGSFSFPLSCTSH